MIKSPRRRRWLGRLLLGLPLLLVLLAAGLALYLWRFPIRTDLVHDRVLSQLERVSGLKVTYDDATLNLSRGEYRIENLALRETKDTTASLFSMGQVIVSLRPLALITRSGAVVGDVEILQPSTIDIVYDQTGPHLGPNAAKVARAFRKARSQTSATLQAHTPDALPFKSLRIRDAKFRFEELVSAAPLVTRPSLVLNGELVVDTKGARRVSSHFEGMGFAAPAEGEAITGRPVVTDLSADATLHRDKKHDDLELIAKASNLSLSDLFEKLPASVISASGLQLNLEAQRTSSTLLLNTMLQADALDVTSPEYGVDIHDQELRAQVQSFHDAKSPRIQVPVAFLNSQLVDAETSGSYSVEDSHPFSINLAATRLGGDYRKLLARFLPDGWNVNAQDESLQLKVLAEGDATRMTALTGDVAFTSVTLTIPGLDQPVKELSGRLNLDPDKLKLNSISGRHAGTRLELTGSWTGNYLARREGQLDLQWNVRSNPEDLLGYVALGDASPSSAPPQPDAASLGTINGQGVYKQYVNLTQPSATRDPEVSGKIEVAGVSVVHPALPAPIEKLKGELLLDGNSIRTNNLTGQIRGNRLQVDGRVQGKRTFWRDPVVSASATTRLDLAKALSYLPPEQQKELAAHKIRGVAVTQFVLNGPLEKLAATGLSGDVQLRDVQLEPDLEFLQGKITGLNATVKWDGNTLRLQDLTAQVNGEPVTAIGQLGAREVALDLEGRFQVDTLLKTFPKLEKTLEGSGPMKYQVRFATESPANTGSDSLTLPELLQTVAQRLEAAVEGRKYSMTGQLELEGATIRHKAMPPARKESGRTIPRGEIRNLRGTALLTGDTLKVSEDDVLTCDFSDTKDCRVSGEIQFRAGDFPRMKVTISSSSELQLDSWILGWGSDLPKLPSPPMSGKEFLLDANISASRIAYKDIRAGRSRASLSFRLVQDETPRVTTFREVVIQGGKPGLGEVRGSGEIESFLWQPRNFPRWQCSVQAQRMPLQDLLNAAFKEPTNLLGMATGRLEVRGVQADPLRISGQGSAALSNLIVGRTTVFQQLGQQTGRNFGGTLFETADAARFEIGNGAMSSRDLRLQTNGMRLDIRGDYYFAGNPAAGIPPKAISGLMRLNFFESVLGRIPLIGDLANLADRTMGTLLLAFRITGTADNPNIAPVPLPLFTGALPEQ